MLTQELLKSFHDWFTEYVNKFVSRYPDLRENLEVKSEHCRKVSNEIVDLAKGLGLEQKDVLLAETIGLFHDVGRFEQYVKYQTFSDSKSQNHADLGVQILKEKDVLKDLSADEKEIIYKSILNHSKAEITPDANERVVFFSKLIRDTDKLDIWRLITEYYMIKEQENGENKSLELELPDTSEISDEVIDAIINKKVVLKESMKTLNDFKLLQVAWVFDLNFKYSVQRVYEKKYLDKIFNALPSNEKVNQIKEIVNDYFINSITVVNKDMPH